MIKLIHPKSYYLIDMHDIDEGRATDAIYDWAVQQDEYMPEGDGHIPMWGIPKLIETYDWAKKAWDILSMFQQKEVLRNEVELRIGVYQ